MVDALLCLTLGCLLLGVAAEAYPSFQDWRQRRLRWQRHEARHPPRWL